MLRIGTLSVLLLVLVASCGDEDEAPGAYASTCMLGKDCEDGLSCILGQCTVNCASDGECTALDDRSVCSGNTCYIACTDSFQCPGSLTCTMFGTSSGTCRP